MMTVTREKEIEDVADVISNEQLLLVERRSLKVVAMSERPVGSTRVVCNTGSDQVLNNRFSVVVEPE